MKNNFRTLKATLIMSIFVLGSFTALASTGSAQSFGIFRYTSDLNFGYDASKAVNIIPADPNGSIIDLYISYQISGILSELAKTRFNNAGINAQIQLSVGEIPSYCNAILTSQLAFIKIDNSFQTAIPNPQLHVTLLEDAPLLAEVKIPINLRATVAPAFPYSIEEMERTFTVSTYAAYIPIIDVIPTRNLMEVPPGQIAAFELECENKGNAETEFLFNVKELPSGWTASMISNTKISPNSKKTVSVEITAPYDFGYHDQLKNIVISVQGKYYAETGGITTSSRVYDVRLTVLDRGFYVSAYHAAILAFVIVAIILIVYIFFRWKQSK
jgi:hypothetical protein